MAEMLGREGVSLGRILGAQGMTELMANQVTASQMVTSGSLPIPKYALPPPSRRNPAKRPRLPSGKKSISIEM